MKGSIMLCLLFLIVVGLMNLPIVNGSGGVWLFNWSPVTEHLCDVFMVNATDGWIVGNGGTTLHWDGDSWTQVSCPVDADLRAVYMLDSDDGWAVGLDGVAIHWNGKEWIQFSSGTTVHLLDIGATYSPHYFAVGASGTVIMWNGTGWEQMTTPTSEGLRGIDLSYLTFPPPIPKIEWGWVVGDSGTTLRYSTVGGWGNITSPTTEQLNDVCIVSYYGDDVWAVGSSWEIIHWNGTDWEIVPNPKKGDYGWLSTVDMVNASNGWAMGYNGTILCWNGKEWTQASSPTINNLNSVFMVEASDGWAVGLQGTIIRWTGIEWIPEFPATLHLPLLFITTLIAIIAAKIRIRKRIRGLVS